MHRDSMQRTMRRAIAAVRPIVVATLAFAVSAGAAAHVTERVMFEPPPDARLEHAKWAYDSSRVWLSGAPRDLGIRAAMAAEHEPFIAIALRRADTETCENLGSQIRRLRIDRPDEALEVWTPPGDSARIAEFLRHERVAGVRIRPAAVDTVITGVERLATPAVFAIGETASLIHGVSHIVRFRNFRLESFAEELAMLPDSVPRR